MGKLFSATKQAVKEFSEDDCMISGAALAFYAIFSLPPLFVLLIQVAGWFGISQQDVQQVVQKQVGMPVGQQAMSTAESGGQGGLNAEPGTAEQPAGEASSESAAGQGSAVSAALGPAFKIVGILILIFSATGLFAQLQYALNRSWNVGPDPEAGGIVQFAIKRALSLGLIVVAAALLFVSLLLTMFMNQILEAIQGGAPQTIAQVIGYLLDHLVVLILATLLFAAMYKILPDAKIQWKDVWTGAFMTAVLFVIGKALIGWYLQSSQVGADWGNAAASMVALLVWIYYSSLVVLFGAELTQVWINRFGHGMEPVKGAVRVVTEKHHVRQAAA